MTKLLYVEASPRKDRSSSIAVARAFLDAYTASHPADTVETLSLWSIDLPMFDGETINAKYAILHGQQHTPEQAAAWRAVVDMAERFKAAEKYVFSVPMWNFGIPYRLKHFIDVITQPGLTFSFSPENGFAGLVTGRPALVVYSRGGTYATDSAMASLDLQKPYLEAWLRFIGFDTPRSIVVEPTLAPEAEAVKQAALAKARRVAASF